jgi:hypothetical protein
MQHRLRAKTEVIHQTLTPFYTMKAITSRWKAVQEKREQEQDLEGGL